MKPLAGPFGRARSLCGPMWETSNVTASLAITGPDLDPDRITALLGVSPDQSRRSGGTGKDGQLDEERSPPRGLWSISTKDRISQTDEISTHIRSLLDRVTVDPDVWAELTQAYKCRVFVGWFLVRTNEMISIDPELLGRLANLGLTLDFDVYEAEGFRHVARGLMRIYEVRRRQIIERRRHK